MRFRCTRCGRDFTTMSMERADKVVFSILVLNKIKCPNCGAGERTRTLKPLRQSRCRWQPKRRSLDTSDYPEPIIVLHDDCQTRLHHLDGKYSVVCDGCPSAFNCLSGNIDDGANIEDDIDKRRAKKVDEAKKYMARVNKQELDLKFKKIEQGLGQFSYQINGLVIYAQFGGTLWKLSEEDKQAILSNSWDTEKTKIIKTTLDKRSIDLSSAAEVLKWKLTTLKLQ